MRTSLWASTLAAVPFMSAGSQVGPPPGRVTPSGRITTTCAGQRIDDILIITAAPSVANLNRVPALQRLARALHATTRGELISRFLLLESGDKCSELRRAESERILRAQPFIADADIYVIPSDRGGVDLEVRTSDEASIVLGAALRGKAPMITSLLLGNANLGGEGVFAAAAWRYGEGFRNGFSGRLIDHQFSGETVVATLEGERASRGGTWRAELMRPFYTDLQRVAWRAQSGMTNTLVEFRRPDDLRPQVSLERNYFDVGGIVRVGSPGHLSLFGLSVSGDDETSGTRLTTGDTGVVTDRGGLERAYPHHRVARANLLLGVRNIRFVRRDGLDALTATQDVPIGFQIGGLIGRSVSALGSKDDDMFMSADVYAGATSGMNLVRLQARGEARRQMGADNWDGILNTARLTYYLQSSTEHLHQVRVEWSGTYRQHTPFQLLFGIPEGGVRGFEKSDLAGGQRLVGHFEERFVLGQVLNQADAGIAFFSDIGRQWAGDVPFGTTTPIKGSVGLGILAAIPPRSGRMWRADIAFPLGSGANSRWTVILTNVDRASFVFREPRDVADIRDPTVPTSIFAWP
ncbi:MAG: hypothetical protein V4550_17655 [Gemmatimonadota bacterium]